MAEAALNMMTRTSAQDYAEEKIYMNSVDTGWINDENPLPKAQAHAEKTNFQTPIDEIDAAARILNPIFEYCEDHNETPPQGIFFKDYERTDW
jgi:NAD(P)-dependent dehydrogenase (short-subunit alcohol dehydrogenase family)